VQLFCGIYESGEIALLSKKVLSELDQVLLTTVGYMNLWSVLLNAENKVWVSQKIAALKEFRTRHKSGALTLPADNS
jgi:hypothetical protein